jgi:subtilisin-like proprotein convertase family protein
MQRRLAWLLLGLLCIGGLAYYWRTGERQRQNKAVSEVASRKQSIGTVSQKAQTPSPFQLLTQRVAAKAAQNGTNSSSRFPYRLSNTTKTVNELAKSDTGILMVNALIDTSEGNNLAIPQHLRAPADNDSYIVQARGSIDGSFRSVLQNAGAEIVSYVPNNAYLVRMSAGQAANLRGNSRVQSVLVYEPYYKLEPSLLKSAVEQTPLAENPTLKLTLFPGNEEVTKNKLRDLKVEILSEERSPFGQLLTVAAPADALVQIAVNSGVEGIQKSYSRTVANDLSRTTLRVSPDTTNTDNNYLGLTGSNVLINLNDTGVDQGHPDLTNRVFADSTNLFSDTVGHGTHVAGIIAGSGVMSSTISNVPPGSVKDANFRGMASGALLYALSLDYSDTYLQEQVAKTNALISNNSWGYAQAFEYNIEAASYDAAVRDALPGKTGAQPVLFVFSAGNSGNGSSGGLSGDPDSILSPGTAKNVITVGALEQLRNITNDVYFDGETNTWFQKPTDSKDQVASFSSRGNVGIGLEGDYGRFKPDVVAPGTFVISTRSSQWDTNAYYHPTNHSFGFISGQTVDPDALTVLPPIFLPDNAVGLSIRVLPNRLSPSPFPDTPIYLRYGTPPTAQVFDFKGTNSVLLPDDFILRNDEILFCGVGDPTNVTLNFNLQTDLMTTNDYGTYYDVLRQLNDDLGPYYRYESGTSMAAPGISGMLGLMQEFFEQRLHMTNSPALMKALLINGARPAGSDYDSQVRNSINYEGWGLANLTNTIPQGLTNFVGQSGSISNSPVLIFDQSPTNALATGESTTRNIKLTAQASTRPLRVTLVWTDPPGNPNVGVKLVNNLDLIVTNLDNGEVYYGNDIPVGSDFTQAWDTNTVPNLDFVNNVENVYLPAPVGTNYSVTVLGRRVNVNAVTGNTNDIVQDYALVISSGNGELTNALTYADTPKQTNFTSNVTTVTNGVPLFNQRVGGNSQYAPTTNGARGQWNFYVFTNTNSYTNVAFVTFLPPEIGVTRIGTRESDGGNSGRAEADIDMYVSQDPRLMDLNPAVLDAAYKSSDRTGTEKVLLSNSSQGQTYYIGIKSEDQEGAEYSFLAVASQLPFGQRDGNGNIIVTMLSSFPVDIPDGSPGKPGHLTIIGVTTEPDAVRRAIVTNDVSHQNFGDTLGTLSHGRKLVALNNHSYFDNPASTNQTFIYDDSGQNDIPGARHTDGPGSLQDFMGDKAASGVWMFTMVDDALTQTGRVEFAGITLEPQSQTNNIHVRLGAHSYWFDFIDVPPNATNLTVVLAIQSSAPAGLEVMIRRGALPTRTRYDKKAIIMPPVGQVELTAYDSPPLNPGRYYIAVYNPNDIAVTFNYSQTLEYDLNPVRPYRFLSAGNEPILDDAVTYSTNHVGIHSHVVSAEVGVRIDHPRISDLVLTLISPQGTRVLLAENRGQLDTNGYGTGVNITNVPMQFTSGGAAVKTNTLNVGQAAGTMIINYDFLSIPDSMHIYYDGVRIFDSGFTSGAGQFTVDFGPGTSNTVDVVMNEGNNAAVDTEWSYNVTVITRSATYAYFTEDTNYTTLPIKFAVPPFGSTNVILAASNAVASSFETVAPGNYIGSVEGWTLTGTNPATVVSATNLADTGLNVLALHSNSMYQSLPTIAGQTYRLQFAYRGQPVLTPISWWKAESNFVDIAGGGNDAQVTTPPVGFAPGVVGTAFNNTTGRLRVVGDPTNLWLTTNFSFEGWIYPSNSAATQAILYRSDSRSGLGAYGLYMSGGDLNFFVTDTNDAQTLITAPCPLNQFVHVACTYSNTLMSLYVNGVLATPQATNAVIPKGALDAGSDPGIGIGNTGDASMDYPFFGLIDEMAIYGQALTAAQIQSIYAAGSAGKCVGGGCSVMTDIVLGGITNTVSANDTWNPYNLTFTAPSNNMVLEIIPHTDGLLMDSFKLVQNPRSNPTNYFLPEESLDKLQGENCFGDWKLEIVDNRAGATNPMPSLVSWQLSLVVDSVTPLATPLVHGVPSTNSVNPNEIKYFSIDVPMWASFATNILANVTNGSVNVLFNQDRLPVSGDFPMFNGVTGGPWRYTLDTNAVPQLLPGQRYYIGVQNLGTTVVDFSFEVDFDITPLTNAVPYTNTLAATGQPRYFYYDVSTNAWAVAFELLNLSGNVDLVARKGAPLPDPATGYDYISANIGTNPESIVVVTNSSPVILTPGRWYLGVFNNDIVPADYTIRATEAVAALIIELTNDVPITAQSVPGAALNTFFHFVIDQTNTTGALFELYNLGGNVDLTLQRGAFPYGPPFAGFSVHPGTNTEQIVIRSNILNTPLLGDWYLGVPNNEPTNVAFTIRGVVSTNGLLTSVIPISVGFTPPPFGSSTGPTLTWPAVDGETYQVQVSTDLVTWTVQATVVATGNTVSYQDFNPITGVPMLFYRIVQVPGP